MVVKITGVLVEPLIEKAPHACKGFVVLAHGKKAMHPNTLNGIQGMLESTSPGHRKFRGNLEQIRFTFNAHNTWTANRSANRKTL